MKQPKSKDKSDSELKSTIIYGIFDKKKDKFIFVGKAKSLSISNASFKQMVTRSNSLIGQYICQYGIENFCVEALCKVSSWMDSTETRKLIDTFALSFGSTIKDNGFNYCNWYENGIEMRHCTSCEKDFPSLCFQLDNRTGRKAICKGCSAEKAAIWRKLNPDKWKLCCKKYREKHNESIKDSHKKYYLLNRESISLRTKEKLRKDPRYKMLRAAKSRAKLYNWPFNITFNDIPSIPEFCPFFARSGVMFPLYVGNGHSTDHSPSIDRIIPHLGYVKGNIQVISLIANRIKTNATLTQVKHVGDACDELVKEREAA
jgi:hypothetical protein